jgi:excisionase family DNA binding protein
MRTETFDAITESEAVRLLTTGEAAALLNSSRQHVVDLCDRGDLPFTTVGTHRRVLRRDVEAIRTRTQRLTRDQRRSLWLAYAVAAQIVTDPDAARASARANVKQMRKAARGQAQRWLDEWERLLDGPVEELLDNLTSRSPKGRELRQNSPFSGLLTTDERAAVLTAWRRHTSGGDT